VLAAVPLLCLGTVGIDAPVAGAAGAPCAGANLSPSQDNEASVNTATLCLIDRERTARHLRPLRANTELRILAHSQVHDMIRWDYFADDRPPGIGPMALMANSHYRAHTKSLSIGQNIGWGTREEATPASMVASWMADPPHRKIMLTGEYRDAGVDVIPAVPSVLEPKAAGATYAVEFAVRRF
jgi:uncharacterized protein YkwD